MTSRSKWLSSSLVLAIAFGAISAPAMAQSYGNQPSSDQPSGNRQIQDDRFRTPSGRDCAIGETNNGGSLSSSSVDDDAHRDSPDPRSCDDVGQP